MTTDLFDDLPQEPVREDIAPGAVLLRGFARVMETSLLDALEAVTAQSPLHHMQTPGGFTMTVATTSCGSLGWVSSAQTDRSATAWYMATWPCGAGRRALRFMGYCRWPMGRTRS